MKEEVWTSLKGMEAKERLNPSSNDNFLNSGLKHGATGFHVILLRDVLVLLQDALFYYKKRAESLGNGREGRMKCGKGI